MKKYEREFLIWMSGYTEEELNLEKKQKIEIGKQFTTGF